MKLKVKDCKGKIKWSSKRKEIAIVDANGVVMGKQAGSTIIYAKIYGKTLKCKVRVLENKKETGAEYDTGGNYTTE